MAGTIAYCILFDGNDLNVAVIHATAATTTTTNNNRNII